MATQLSVKNILRRLSWLGAPRLVTIVLTLAMVVGVVVWAAYESFQEETLDPWLDFQPLIQPKSYQVILDSVDEASRIAHLRAELRYKKSYLSFSKEAEGLLQELQDHPDSIHVFFGPFEITDFSQIFNSLGLGAVQSVMKPGNRNAPGPDFSESVPSTTDKDVYLLGNPRLYPFDRYVLLAQVNCEALVTGDGKSYLRMPGDRYAFESKVPTFVIAGAGASELENWDTSLKRALNSIKDISGENSDNYKNALKAFSNLPEKYKADLWQHGGIALELQRPFFIKFFACFLGAVALLSIFYIAKSSEPKMFLLNAVGYFVGLWAVREALSAGAPKTPTLVDYSVMLLYTVLVTVMLARFLARGFKKAD